MEAQLFTCNVCYSDRPIDRHSVEVAHPASLWQNVGTLNCEYNKLERHSTSANPRQRYDNTFRWQMRDSTTFNVIQR